MVRKLKIKLVKKSAKCIFIVVSLNQKSIRAHYLEKVGTIFIVNKKKYIFLNVKKLCKWLNKGAKINTYVSFLFTILYSYGNLNYYNLK